jgi:hypothetical protein
VADAASPFPRAQLRAAAATAGTTFAIAAAGDEAQSAARSAGGNRPRNLHAQTAIPDLGTRKRGVDWPCFLGPTRDSKSSEKGLVTPWPKQGPRIVWQRPLGEGYGIGSVTRGRFLQFDRERDEAVLLCLNAETGDELWRFAYSTDYSDLYGYNGGPRASPVVDDDRVYILAPRDGCTACRWWTARSGGK